MTLKWAAPKGAKPAYYVVVRDGKSLGRTTRASFTDTTVKAGRTYRYAVRAYDKAKRAGALTPSRRVTVPKQTDVPTPGTPGTSNPAAPIAAVTPTPEIPSVPTPVATPTPVPSPYDTMTEAMVDRLFWRAGFGPTQAQRDAWVGKRHADLVEWLVSTPASIDTSMLAPKTAAGATTIDPLAGQVELELEWIDRMQRAVNPLPERLVLFWHRHWVISLNDGSVSNKWAYAYRNHLLRYSDLGAHPGATFRQLAYEMTTANAAMSSYLNLNANTKTRPNENYAREIMELFCLGPKDPAGNDNYTQEDIVGLTQAFTGWRLNGAEFLADKVTPNPDYGKITFDPKQFHMPAKTVLGRVIAAETGKTDATNPDNVNWGPRAVNAGVDIVLEHPQHAQFLIRKLWGEFMAGPIPQATLDALSAEYRANGYQLKPLIRGILLNTEIFESLEEPNLIKPPVVYMVGVLRALGAPVKGNVLQGPMNSMQQRIYNPPNVAGWEGGMSWLNTNTVQARFDMVKVAQSLRYSNGYYADANAAASYAPDVRGETAAEVLERAYASVGRPWISGATRAQLLAFAQTLTEANRTGTSAAAITARRQRFYALQAMILGGPDGQVM
ncbi:DUF1800 family protein [Solirubrobacter sp. CPCC 204708]|uniref:DUF1800 family protein n=1 Tax=Solirubrobacter deserti TaxID=2282478 RepID=A0ABT4RC98_9ACTN|nr:DUF1800 family protein [Solirubrobacter deserti]MBE2315510.1 DUF1800 family protein [Solirubrobacter deserti]MDA0136149.1 DUF1800 family protein [Solirubrobacter deserti]